MILIVEMSLRHPWLDLKRVEYHPIVPGSEH